MGRRDDLEERVHIRAVDEPAYCSPFPCLSPFEPSAAVTDHDGDVQTYVCIFLVSLPFVSTDPSIRPPSYETMHVILSFVYYP